MPGARRRARRGRWPLRAAARRSRAPRRSAAARPARRRTRGPRWRVRRRHVAPPRVAAVSMVGSGRRLVGGDPSVGSSLVARRRPIAARPAYPAGRRRPRRGPRRCTRTMRSPIAVGAGRGSAVAGSSPRGDAQREWRARAARPPVARTIDAVRRAAARSRSRAPASPAGPSTARAAAAASRRRTVRAGAPPRDQASAARSAAGGRASGPSRRAGTVDRRASPGRAAGRRARASRPAAPPGRGGRGPGARRARSRVRPWARRAVVAADQPTAGPPSAPSHLGAVRHDDLGRGRRCRRADVGREVGQRDVDLVADAADDRERVRHDRADDPFVVERPEVLERTAAAGEDRDRRVRPRSRPSRSSSRGSVRVDGTPPRCWPARPRPGPGAATSTTRASGQRRARTVAMSFQTAPVGLVMTAMVVGRVGNGRLRAGSNSPSAVRRALSSSNRSARSPTPAGCSDST